MSLLQPPMTCGTEWKTKPGLALSLQVRALPSLWLVPWPCILTGLEAVTTQAPLAFVVPFA